MLVVSVHTGQTFEAEPMGHVPDIKVRSLENPRWTCVENRMFWRHFSHRPITELPSHASV